jgi:hypothetical protein
MCFTQVILTCQLVNKKLHSVFCGAINEFLWWLAVNLAEKVGATLNTKFCITQVLWALQNIMEVY